VNLCLDGYWGELIVRSNIVHFQSSGELYNENGQCQSIYRILKVNTVRLEFHKPVVNRVLLYFTSLLVQDTAKCLAGEPMKRITMSYSHFSYVVTLDEHNIYIAKVKSE